MDKLKEFLLGKGENIDNLSDNEILQRVKQVRKGQELINVENEICSHCSKKFDDCRCNKCRECYQVICECIDDIKMIKIISKEDEIREKNQKEKEKQEKKIMKRQLKEREKKEKREKKIKEREIEKQKSKDKRDESLLLISLYSYKIKLKIFLLDKVIPYPKLYPDVIELLNLILLKHNVELKDEEKENINTIFNKIYNEDIKKQKAILKCIIDNLVK